MGERKRGAFYKHTFLVYIGSFTTGYIDLFIYFRFYAMVQVPVYHCALLG